MNTNRSKKRMPPKTHRLPLVGPLSALIKDPFGFVDKARETCGDIYTVDFGLKKAVVLTHPDQMKYIFITNVSDYIKGEAYEPARVLIGDSLPSSDGQRWRKKRRMMQPHFHKNHIKNLSFLMSKAIKKNLISWSVAATNGESFDLGKSLYELSLIVITQTMFGETITPKENEITNERITFLMHDLNMAVLSSLLPSWVPEPTRKRFIQYREDIKKVLEVLIKRRRESNNEDYDLLFMLINMIDEESGTSFNNKELFDEIMAVFIAGYETTATTLIWFFYLLNQHPEIANKVETEINNVCKGSEPAMAHLDQLTYTYMVINEVLRMYPPVSFMSRTAAKANEIDGYYIPEGTFVIAMTHSTHYHPDIWENPQKFDPERFSPEQKNLLSKFAWMPFGMGQRTCIGKEFAIMEIALVVAHIFQRYKILFPTGTVVEPNFGPLRSPKGKVWVTLKKR